ncbi:MAG: DUF4131 domain-containing protein, partial [Zoogloeaceae bacterium]|nr:DUF4131 domain-containing protein [Zoogloeaceae bacterium]
MNALSVFLLALVCGVCFLQTRADLPEMTWVWAFVGLGVFFVALLLARLRSSLRGGALLLAVCAGLTTGYGWAAWRAAERLADELPLAWEGRDVRVVGVVASLPTRFDRGVRFVLRVEEVLTPGAK